MRLTREEVETIRIHMNAFKENLCNQYRWKEAEEYQTIVDKLDDLMTVDAIPVEWLKSHMITAGEVANGDYFEDEALELNMYVSDLIGRWQAERKEE